MSLVMDEVKERVLNRYDVDDLVEALTYLLKNY